MGKRSNSKKQQTGGNAAARSPAISSVVDSAFLSVHSSNPNPKFIGPFSDKQDILVVGDGDFSFSVALAVALSGSRIVATCYDSKEEVLDKYSEARANIRGLQATGARVYFGIDCTSLCKYDWVKENTTFHRIVFNFPHVGGSTEEDVVNNQQLLRGFFSSAREFLHKEQGRVVVSLRDTVFYNSWKIKNLGPESGMELAQVKPFQEGHYHGYQAQRTHPGMREPPSTEGAKMYFFKRARLLNESLVGPREPSSVPKIKITAEKKRSMECKDKEDTGGEIHAQSRKEMRKRKRMEKKAERETKRVKVPAHQGDSRSGRMHKAATSVVAFSCELCALKFQTEAKYNGHINSTKHAKRVKATGRKSK